MKRKMMAIGLCLMIFLSMPMQAFAQEINSYSVSPRFTYIGSYRLSLRVADGNAHIEAEVEGKSGVTESYIKCNLEKLTGSTYWMQMKSFSSTGSSYANLYTDYAIDHGTYRVMGIFRCNTETQTVYTGNETY